MGFLRQPLPANKNISRRYAICRYNPCRCQATRHAHCIAAGRIAFSLQAMELQFKNMDLEKLRAKARGVLTAISDPRAKAQG
jgi:hypothetical protein